MLQAFPAIDSVSAGLGLVPDSRRMVWAFRSHLQVNNMYNTEDP